MRVGLARQRSPTSCVTLLYAAGNCAQVRIRYAAGLQSDSCLLRAISGSTDHADAPRSTPPVYLNKPSRAGLTGWDQPWTNT
jgi:hypothetical protein